MFLCLSGRLALARPGPGHAAWRLRNHHHVSQVHRGIGTLRDLDRVTAVEGVLPVPGPSGLVGPGCAGVRGHGGGSERRLGNGSFPGKWRIPGGSWSTQTRASSTKGGHEGETRTDKEHNLAEDRTSEEPEGAKPNKTQQLKKVFKEYGAVGVSFHICISLMSLGMFYLLISSGIDMAAVLCKLGFSEAVVRSKMAAGTSTFVLAYAIHKLFAPVRISITLVSVPLIVRYFRKTGLFKPPTAAP